MTLRRQFVSFFTTSIIPQKPKAENPKMNIKVTLKNYHSLRFISQQQSDNNNNNT